MPSKSKLYFKPTAKTATRQLVSIKDMWTLTQYANEINVKPGALLKLVEDGNGPVPAGKFKGEFVFTEEAAQAWELECSKRSDKVISASKIELVDASKIETGTGNKFVAVAREILSGEALSIPQIKARFIEAGYSNLWKSDSKAVNMLTVSCTCKLDTATGLALYTWRRLRAPRSDRGLTRRKTIVTTTTVTKVTTNGRSKIKAETSTTTAVRAKRK